MSRAVTHPQLPAVRFARLMSAVLVSLTVLLAFGNARATAAPVCGEPYTAENPFHVVQDRDAKVNVDVCYPGTEDGAGEVSYQLKPGTAPTARGGTLTPVATVEESWGGTAVTTTYRSAAAYTGADSFTVTATDGSGSTDVTFNLFVDPRQAPICADDPDPDDPGAESAAIRSGTSRGFFLPCYSPTEHTGMTYAIESQPAPAAGTVTLEDPDQGNFQFLADAGYTGSATFSYSATNSVGKSNIATVTVTISPTVNEAPGCYGRTYVLRTGGPRRIPFDCYDADGDRVVYSLPAGGGPSHGTVGDLTQHEDFGGSVLYTPAAGYVGTDSFKVVGTDSLGAASEMTLTVDLRDTTYNTAPECSASDENPEVESGATVTLNVSCWDAEQDVMQFEISQPAHGSVSWNTVVPDVGYGETTLRYTPQAGYTGPDSFKLAATDEYGASHVVTLNATVIAPQAPNCHSPASPLPVRTGRSKAIWLSCSGSEDGKGIAISITDQPDHGTVTKIGTSPNSYLYTPAAGYSGSDSLKFTGTNAIGTSAPATFQFAVSPSANELPNCFGDEPVEMRANTVEQLHLTCYDPDGDPLTITATQPLHGKLEKVSNSQYTYAPAANYVGPDSFTFTANDGFGDSPVETQGILVHEATWNSVPKCYGGTFDESIEKGQPLTISPDCDDAQGDAITYAIVKPASHGTASVVTHRDEEGQAIWTSLKYVPTAGYVGTDGFTFVAKDGLGQTDEITVNITVTEPVPPTCTAASPASTRSGLRTYLSSDCYGGTGGGPVTYVVTDEPDHGTLSKDSWGFFYTSDPGYEGADSFTYKARNSVGDSAAVTQQVTLSKNYNTAPECYSSGPGEGLTVRSGRAKMVHLYCWDAERDRLTYRIATAPSHGSLGPIQQPTAEFPTDSGSVTYTPTAGYTGADSFAVKANDGRADSVESGRTTFNVVAATANTAPTCSSNGPSTKLAQNVPYELSESRLTGSCYDEDDDELTAKIVQGPAHGTLSEPVDGVRRYTPAAGYTGQDTIKVKAHDGLADSTDATTFTFEVTAPTPVTPQPVVGPGGATVPITTYTDPNGEAVITIPSGQVARFEGGCMPLTLTTEINPGAGGQVIDPILVLEPSDGTPVRAESPLTGGNATAKSTWTATIACVETGDLFVEYTLKEGTEEMPVRVPLGGLVLIDPQGVVHDKAKFDTAKAAGKTDEEARAHAAISGATVVLQRRTNGEWKKVLAGDPGITPNVNPQVTGANGLFQWDVSEGTYRVVVTAEGYDSVTSRAVEIPPPVLDLHIAMTKKPAPVDPGGGTTDPGTTDPGTGGTTTPGTGGTTTPPATAVPIVGGTTPGGTTPAVPCLRLTGVKRATCQANLRYAAGLKKCGKLSGKRKTACVKKTKLARNRTVALAKCAPLKGAKKAACVKKAKAIKR